MTCLSGQPSSLIRSLRGFQQVSKKRLSNKLNLFPSTSSQSFLGNFCNQTTIQPTETTLWDGRRRHCLPGYGCSASQLCVKQCCNSLTWVWFLVENTKLNWKAERPRRAEDRIAPAGVLINDSARASTRGNCHSSRASTRDSHLSSRASTRGSHQSSLALLMNKMDGLSTGEEEDSTFTCISLADDTGKKHLDGCSESSGTTRWLKI